MAGPVRIGVLGTGSIGIRGALIHLAVGDFSDRVVAQAVCDPVPGRAQAAAERFGVPQAFDSLEAMLAGGEIDAITVCSPIGIHYEQGLQAIAAGKHLHFNKTMTTTTVEADDLIAKAEAAGVKLAVSPGQMHRPHLRRIKQALEAGEIGRLVWSVTGAAFGKYHEEEPVRQGEGVLYSTNPEWYWRKYAGGPLYDMTVYGLHALTGILGPAKRVAAMSGARLREREFRGQTYASDCEDNTGLLIDFGDALFAFAYGTAAGSVNPAFGTPSFFGVNGSIVGEELNGQPLQYPGRERADAAGMNAVLPDYRESHPTEEFHVFQDLLSLADLVREGTPTVATAEHARHVIEIIEAAYRASETGQTQELRTTF